MTANDDEEGRGSGPGGECEGRVFGTGIPESRLDDLRREAEAKGQVERPGLVPSGAPFPLSRAADGYYGLPLLKKPVWTWEVPAYFFVGGAAGVAAVLAEASRLGRDGEALARDARWLAAIGAGLSGPLLIADLGRPERFLAMLRVFKPQSPMSVGAWTVLAFSGAASAALAGQLLEQRFPGLRPARALTRVASPVAAATGLGMATYTGVLVGATAVPVWSRNVRLLPFHFAFSALGAAVSLLQLRGHRHGALRRLGLLAAIAETAVGAAIELAPGRANAPLTQGVSGSLMRASGVLAGPVPLVLRLFGRRSRAAALAAAASAIAGSLFTRYGWVAAGRSSAMDPGVPLNLPAGAQRTAPAAVLPGTISREQAPVTVTGKRDPGREP